MFHQTFRMNGTLLKSTRVLFLHISIQACSFTTNRQDYFRRMVLLVSVEQYRNRLFKEKRLRNVTLLSQKWTLHRPSTSHSLRFLSTRELTHIDEKGKSKMIDVGNKQTTRRTATAVGIIHVGPLVARLIQKNNIKKGDAISIARLAGIVAAKKTSDLIPLCHNITLNDVQVEATLQDENVMIEATVKCDGKTGVEMEALTAVAVAALTVYDMCKAVTHDMCIKEIKLTQKTGGSRGDFQR